MDELDFSFPPLEPLSELASEILRDLESRAGAGEQLLGSSPEDRDKAGIVLCPNGPLFSQGIYAYLRLQRGKKEDLRWLKNKCDPEVLEAIQKSNVDNPAVASAVEAIRALTTSQMNDAEKKMQALGEIASHPRGAMLLFGEKASKTVSIKNFLEYIYHFSAGDFANEPAAVAIWPYSPFVNEKITNAYHAVQDTLICWSMLSALAPEAEKLRLIWRNPVGKLAVIAVYMFRQSVEARQAVDGLRDSALRHYQEPVRMGGAFDVSWHHLSANAAIACFGRLFAKARPLDASDSLIRSPEKLTADELKTKWAEIKSLFKPSADINIGELVHRVHFEAGKFDVLLGRSSSDETKGFPILRFDAAHGTDFRSVKWGEFSFSFTKNQAPIVRLLWENWERGTPDVGDEMLLQAVDHEAPPARLNAVFPNNQAWGKMIVRGKTNGTHRICEPPKKS